MEKKLTPLEQIQAVSKGYGVSLGDICSGEDGVKMSFQNLVRAGSFVQMLAESLQPQVRIRNAVDGFDHPVEIGFPLTDDPFGHEELYKST